MGEGDEDLEIVLVYTCVFVLVYTCVFVLVYTCMRVPAKESGG